MKSIAIFTLLLGVAFLNSCKKTEEAPPSGPDPVPATHFALQFKASVTLAAGEQPGDYEFIVTLSNNDDEPVLVDKKLALIDSGGFYSGKLELQRGTYKLSKFLLARKTGLVRFATPLAGAPKAQQVTRPLAIVTSNGQGPLKVQEVEILPVQLNDHESFFGYPEGIFNLPVDPDDPAPATKTIRVHPVVKIGDVVYDSVPTFMQLFSWDQQNNPSLVQFTSTGGIHKLLLPENAVRFKIRMTKWTGQAEIEMRLDEVDESKVYKLEVTKAPQQLKQLLTYRLTNNVWVPIEKIEYQYDGLGKQLKRLHYRKHTDGSAFLAMTEDAEFSGNRVLKIVRKAEDGRIIGNTQFQYDGNGLVSIIRHQEGADSVTFITVSYITSLDANNKLQVDQVGAHYEYSFSSMKHTYQGDYDKGVLVKDALASMNGNWEEGLYQHDQSINPFYKNDWPDLNKLIVSKHNLGNQWKTYVNSWPPFELYNFVYTYTPEGYPKELRKDHRHGRTKEHLNSYKEVFVY